MDLLFPRWVYKGFGREMESRIAGDAGEYSAAMDAGWRGCVEERPSHLEVPDFSEEVVEASEIGEAEKERATLESAAKELGLKFNKNTSSARLQDLIQKYGG